MGSSVILVCVLYVPFLCQGIDSQLVVLSNIIDREFTTLNQDFYDYLSEQMGKIVRECGDKVPVLTGRICPPPCCTEKKEECLMPWHTWNQSGFFGNVPGSLLDTIGRGYTDLCAALVAVGLGADELQIWKEVDGVFTADPRKVSSARLLPLISPEEAAELTYYGSEVIHPFTMEQVIRAEIPIRIKNVENPAGPGTLIFPERQQQGKPTTAVVTTNGTQPQKAPTAVTIKDNICVINVHSNRKNVSHGFLAKIFATLDEHGIIVDLISTSEVHVSMALSADIPQSNLDKAIAKLRSLGTVGLTDQCRKWIHLLKLSSARWTILQIWPSFHLSESTWRIQSVLPAKCSPP